MKNLHLNQEQYHSLDKYGGWLIFLIIRIIFGLMYNSVMLFVYIWSSDAIFCILFGVCIGLFVPLIIYFFSKKRQFILFYIIYTAFNTGIIFVLLAMQLQIDLSVLLSFIIDSLFLLYLLLSKRAAVVFRSANIRILPQANVPAQPFSYFGQPYQQMPHEQDSIFHPQYTAQYEHPYTSADPVYSHSSSPISSKINRTAVILPSIIAVVVLVIVLSAINQVHSSSPVSLQNGAAIPSTGTQEPSAADRITPADSASELDPLGFLNSPSFLGSDISVVLAGLIEGIDYNVDKSDPTIDYYTIYPEFNYLGIEKNETNWIAVNVIKQTGVVSFIEYDASSTNIPAFLGAFSRKYDALQYELGTETDAYYYDKIDDEQYISSTYAKICDLVSGGQDGFYFVDWANDAQSVSLSIYKDPSDNDFILGVAFYLPDPVPPSPTYWTGNI